jgi:hypothetical protein
LSKDCLKVKGCSIDIEQIVQETHALYSVLKCVENHKDIGFFVASVGPQRAEYSSGALAMITSPLRLKRRFSMDRQAFT